MAKTKQPPAVRNDSWPQPNGQTQAGSILNGLSGLGTGGDKGVAGTPNIFRQPLSYQELTALFRYNALAAKICDRPAKDMTRAGWTIDDDSDDTDPMREEDRRLQIQQRAREAVRWARVYGGALIWVVTDDDIAPDRTGSQDLSEPIDLSKIRRVRNLVVLDWYEFSAARYETNPASPNFRKPSVWFVYPRSPGGSSPGGMVHASRCLYIRGAALPEIEKATRQGRDDSVLERAWDAIRTRTQVDQAGGTLAQDLRVSVIRIAGLAGQMVSDTAQYLLSRFTLMAQSRSILNTLVLGDGETFENVSTSLAGFDHLDAMARSAVAAAADMPEQLLFGDTPSGLNTDGESWRVMWEEKITGDQQDVLYEPLVKLYAMLYAQQLGPTNGRTPENWDLRFNPLRIPTPKETAEIRRMNAQTDAIYVNARILPASHIAKSRFPDEGYSTETLPWAGVVPDPAQDTDPEPVPIPEDDPPAS